MGQEENGNEESIETKYSKEKSREEAAKIKSIQEQVIGLDDEYLEAALKEMKQNHSHRESMAMFNPNPFVHNEQQDLNEAKLHQFDLILQLRKNVMEIAKCQGSLMRARQSSREMGKLFGGLD